MNPACDAGHQNVAVFANTEVSVTMHPSFDAGDNNRVNATETGRAAAEITELRRQLLARLERHIDTSSFQPALTLVGFNGTSADVLRHGVDRPEDAILGFDLPPRYRALGVLASSIVSTTSRASHHDAALALAVTRDGIELSMLATVAEGVVDTSKPSGWLIDACRRSVGLATEPCDVSALAFPIALWLDRLMVAILNAPSGSPVLWSDAVDLCPIPRRWRSSDPIDLGTTLGSTARSWRALRAAAVEGMGSPSGLAPDLARWMDDPMFARWCMGSFPDLNNLRSDVEFLASDHVAEQVALALRAGWSAFAG